jgi:hypothetical protein
MADARICVRISHAMAPFPTAEADAPTFDQGEIAENPKPVPSESKMSASDAATNAPPITAAQETPDEYDSFLSGISADEN